MGWCCAQSFKAWKAKNEGKREQKDAQAEADRRRKGQLTGREIFMQASLSLKTTIYLIFCHWSLATRSRWSGAVLMDKSL